MAKTEMGSLDSLIEKSQVECLNQLAGHPVSNIFDGSELYLSSDTDAQLLIKIGFRQPVKLNSIKVQTTPDAWEKGSAPSRIKIFQNKPNMGFAEAEDDACIEEFEFEEGDNGALKVGGEENKQVKFVKYQNVTTLQLFIPANNNEDESDVTLIKRIELFGCPAQNMDMAAWKPVKG